MLLVRTGFVASTPVGPVNVRTFVVALPAARLAALIQLDTEHLRQLLVHCLLDGGADVLVDQHSSQQRADPQAAGPQSTAGPDHGPHRSDRERARSARRGASDRVRVKSDVL